MLFCMLSSKIAKSHALGGLVVGVLATEPTGHSVAGSNPVDFMGDKNT
jgi:hypothetical protein